MYNVCTSMHSFSISDIKYEFVIERRTTENVRFSRALFSNDASIQNGMETVTRGSTRCVSETIHFRVS